MHPWRTPLLLVAATAISAAATWWMVRPTPSPAAPPALMELEGMGHLVSLKVRTANVIDFTQERTQGIPWTQWELRLGGTHVLLVARGDCLVGTDLRQARYEAIDATARTATLHVPAPTVLSARIDHRPREQGGSYFYAIDSTGIEYLIPGSANRIQAIDAALHRAQQDLERSCQSAPSLANARTHAEAALQSLFSATGWKVQLRWPS